MLRFTTAGESHGPALVSILEGLPAGLPITAEQVNAELSRRQQGYGRGRRMQIEKDEIEFLSGVRGGETLGGPVAMLIRNRDWKNWQALMEPMGPVKARRTSPRPVPPRKGAGAIVVKARDTSPRPTPPVNCGPAMPVKASCTSPWPRPPANCASTVAGNRSAKSDKVFMIAG